jgi:pilus assembly protein FimV
MVFGFGFSKQKALSSAEKYVQQGKLQNAIAEYEKILKADPRDLTVLNTIGDLYARIGDNGRAIEYFKQVGDAYASDGFTVKAIAVYKKISKLQPSLEGTLKLAELFTQQGLFNDARAQYLQVAEEFLRSGELEKAIRIFQKTLEMDPDNVAMKLRLAEVYLRLGKKNDASKIYGEASQTLRENGQLDAADEVLQKMQAIDPSNSGILLLRGRNAVEAGEFKDAIQLLEKVADLDQHPDGLRDLMKAYLQDKRLPQAGMLASKLFTVHHDKQSIADYADALMAGGSFEEALQVYQQHSDALLSSDSAKVTENLHAIIGHVRENCDALEAILALLQKAGDTSHTSEILELLAHASVQQDDLPKARDLYLQLATMEPQNALHSRNYQQVVAKLGASGGSSQITSEEGALMVDELEAIAPFIDQHYSDEISAAARAALTDAELFVSYNMPEKALGPLAAALPSAPHHVKLNQRLAALYTRTGRFSDAALCCRTLQSVYNEAGFPEESSRYGDLADKYEDRGALAAKAAAAGTPADLHTSSPVAANPWPAAVVEAPAPKAPPAKAAPASTHGVAEFAIVTPDIEDENEDQVAAPAAAPVKARTETPAPAVEPKFADYSTEVPSGDIPNEDEIDLSEEWEGSAVEGSATEDSAAAVSAEPAAGATPEPAVQPSTEDSVAATIAEIHFYLQYGMVQQAHAGLAKLEGLTDDRATLDALRTEVALKTPQAPEQPKQPEIAEVEPVAMEAAELEIAPEPEPASQPVASAAPSHAPASLDEFVADLEASLPEDFMAPAAPSIPPAHIVAPPPATHAAASLSEKHSAQGSAAAAQPALDRKQQPVPAPAPVPTISAPVAPSFAAASTAAPVSAAQAEVGADLNDMFDELRAGLEDQSAPAQEDPEDHYNLGVAFREMGLVDEAIGELQKVCQSIDRGAPFKYTMQAYTWLAQCFLDKGVPEASIRWYEKALKIRDIDEEAKTALHYELASAYEAAQNKRAALAHFMEVYGANIDYRDVGERIHALKS